MMSTEPAPKTPKEDDRFRRGLQAFAEEVGTDIRPIVKDLLVAIIILLSYGVFNWFFSLMGVHGRFAEAIYALHEVGLGGVYIFLVVNTLVSLGRVLLEKLKL